MINIGGQDLKTSRPADLDAQLIASTGCGVTEIETLLAAGPDRVARALAPFLDKDAPAGIELGRLVAADPDAVAAIRKLYAAGGTADAKPEVK